MLGSRYTRGAPPLVGMRMATPVVRAAPPAALLTACLAGGCDGGAAGAWDRQPQCARPARRRYDPEARKRPRPTRKDTGDARTSGIAPLSENAGTRLRVK